MQIRRTNIGHVTNCCIVESAHMIVFLCVWNTKSRNVLCEKIRLKLTFTGIANFIGGYLFGSQQLLNSLCITCHYCFEAILVLQRISLKCKILLYSRTTHERLNWDVSANCIITSLYHITLLCCVWLGRIVWSAVCWIEIIWSRIDDGCWTCVWVLGCWMIRKRAGVRKTGCYDR